jgi:hypothetical protein
MRILGWLFVTVLFAVAISQAQQAPDAPQPVGTMAEVMVSMTHPAANEIQLAIARGGPGNDKEWAAVQRSAVLLGESGNVLLTRNRQPEWSTSARAMIEAATVAYKAARAKDAKALAQVSSSLDASCVSCHTRFRPNVHPAGR